MINRSIYYEVVIPFGKYKDRSLGFIQDVDPNYLKWLSEADGLPELWKIAATRIIAAEPIDDLSLPRQIYKQSNLNVQLTSIDADTIGVKFDYDPEFLDRFKFEIDGRKWNKDRRCWEVSTSQVIKLISFFGGPRKVIADDKVKAVYQEELKRREDLDHIRIQEDMEIVIPGLKLPLFGYQNTGVRFVERANGRALIADSMGLGKTLQAIAYAEYKNLKTLIICPKTVKTNWVREIQKFTGKSATVWEGKLMSGKATNRYHIINYDIVEKNVVKLNKLKFDLLVCDEATYIKNKKTKRTKAILGDKRTKGTPGIKTDHVLFLTGTPVMNRPVEAFTLLHFIDDTRFNNFFQFTQKYGGWRGDPPRNLEDLHDRTKDLVIRRLKKDILKDLPPKIRSDLFVELEPTELKSYNKLLDDLFRKWRSLGKPTLGEMHAIQQFLLQQKLPRIREIIDELIEQDRSVLIFSCYLDPLFTLAKEYGDKTALIHGTMTSIERQDSIDRLSSGKAKIGLFSLGAGAMGIDGLQHSMDTVVFMDRWWVPAIHDQAEDRLFRTGQTKQVQCYYVTCENTIDEYMAKILKEKQEIIDRIVDGQIVNFDPQKSFFKEFVKMIREDREDEFETVSLDFTDRAPKVLV